MIHSKFNIKNMPLFVTAALFCLLGGVKVYAQTTEKHEVSLIDWNSLQGTSGVEEKKSEDEYGKSFWNSNDNGSLKIVQANTFYQAKASAGDVLTIHFNYIKNEDTDQSWCDIYAGNRNVGGRINGNETGISGESLDYSHNITLTAADITDFNRYGIKVTGHYINIDKITLSTYGTATDGINPDIDESYDVKDYLPGGKIDKNGGLSANVGYTKIDINRRSFDNDGNATYTPVEESEVDDWYDNYFIKGSDITENARYGDIIRIMIKGAREEAFGYMKYTASGFPAIMSGADKFSIGGWKYMDVTYCKLFEDKLNETNNGLACDFVIGGYAYTLAGAYIIKTGDGNNTHEWTRARDVEPLASIEQNAMGTPSSQTSSEGTTWKTYSVEGGRLIQEDFNTRNFMFRVYTNKICQISVKDPEGYSYLVDYVGDIHNDYADTRENVWADGETHYYYDIPMSGTITKFNDGNSATAIKSGKRYEILDENVCFGVNSTDGGDITKVEIVRSETGMNVSGYAEFKHKLTDQYWKPIALPYNIGDNPGDTDEDNLKAINDIFGDGTKVMELQQGSVTSKDERDENGRRILSHLVTIHFKNVDAIKANKPYIIKAGTPDADDTYRIRKVWANTRDYRTYQYICKDFDLTGLDNTKTEELLGGKTSYEYCEEALKGQSMSFISTAPTIKTRFEAGTPNGKLDLIDGNPEYYTDIHAGDFYFYQGNIYKSENTKHMKFGLGYIELSDVLYNIAIYGNKDGKQETANSRLMLATAFDDGETTGISETAGTVSRGRRDGIYTMEGVKINAKSVNGLPKGMYIVNGKKIIL